MDKQIKDLTDLELAQAVGQTYQTIINLNNQLEAINMEIKTRQQKPLTETPDGPGMPPA